MATTKHGWRRGWYVLAAALVFGGAALGWGHAVRAEQAAPLPDADTAYSGLLTAQVAPGPEALLTADQPPKPAPGAEPPAQPPPTRPPTTRSDMMSSLFGRTAASEPSPRLAGMPNMFGDLFFNFGQMAFAGLANAAAADIPLAAGCRRAKVCENNLAMPQDRIHFMYNHFQNPIKAVVADPTLSHQFFCVDRYTMAFEKTLLDRLWSVEVRMPFAGAMNYDTPDFTVSGGSVGNLAVLLKRSVYQSCTTAVAIGLGIDMPTGSDAQAFFDLNDYTIRNQAVHLMPFAGFVRAPGDCWFYQGFLQVDVPTNGNRVDFNDLFLGPGTAGVLNEQTLLYVDLAAGCWLYRNPCATYFTGLAALVEFHYTTTLQDADIIAGSLPLQDFAFGNFSNHVDVTNVTVGLHAEFAHHTLARVAGVFPLQCGDDRSFDAEVQVQLERRF